MSGMKEPFPEITYNGQKVEIIELLGKGKYGAVWHASHPDFPVTEVALKTLYQGDYDPQNWLKIQQEVKALVESSNLNNPNIVRYYGSFKQNDQLYIMMEYCKYGNLEQLAFNQTHKGVLTADHIVRYMIQICRGLEFAHSKGIIHGDIKPANVLLGSDPKKDIPILKLADFGQARVPEELYGYALSLRGDHRYMSPERIQGQSIIQSDIYSLGATLYRLLTKKHYLNFGDDKDTNISLILDKNHIITPPHKIESMGFQVSVGLSKIAMTALSYETWKRYSSVRQMLHDLEIVEKGKGKLRLVNTPTAWLNFGKSHLPSLRVSVIVLFLALVTLSILAFTIRTTSENIAATFSPTAPVITSINPTLPTTFTINTATLSPTTSINTPIVTTVAPTLPSPVSTTIPTPTVTLARTITSSSLAPVGQVANGDFKQVWNQFWVRNVNPENPNGPNKVDVTPVSTGSNILFLEHGGLGILTVHQNIPVANLNYRFSIDMNGSYEKTYRYLKTVWYSSYASVSLVYMDDQGNSLGETDYFVGETNSKKGTSPTASIKDVGLGWQTIRIDNVADEIKKTLPGLTDLTKIKTVRIIFSVGALKPDDCKSDECKAKLYVRNVEFTPN